MIEIIAAAVIFFCVGVVLYLRFFSPFDNEEDWVEDSEYMQIVEQYEDIESKEGHQTEKRNNDS